MEELSSRDPRGPPITQTLRLWSLDLRRQDLLYQSSSAIPRGLRVGRPCGTGVSRA